MIAGFFRESGRPYVRCRLLVPRFQIDAIVNFLVDTGADSTVIHPIDIRDAGIPVAFPAEMPGTEGVGGVAEFFSERATLIFTDADRITQYRYPLDIGIAKPDEHNRDFPSLLGRDVLDCWYLESDPTNGLLQFTVRRLL